MEIQNNQKMMRIPASEHPRVVVIGGGFAGLSIARSLKNQPVQVVILDKNNFHQFQPLLYQVATSGIMPDSIIFPLRKQFEKYKNVIFRMTEVNTINEAQKTIETTNGTLHYDYLVLATGSDTNFFGLNDVQANSLGMKSIQEALNIRSMMLQQFEKAVLTTNDNERDALTNFAVIGGGPAGVETVGAIAEFKRFILPKDYPDLDTSEMSIYLIEASNRLLGGMSKESSDKALAYLKKMGVKVYLNTGVQSYDGTTIKTNKNIDFVAKGVIWTAGVRGNVIEGINNESIARGNRLIVDEYSAVKGCNAVYAIGDIAAMITDKLPKGHPMVAQVAIQQGRLLGKNLVRQMNGKTLEKFVYKDKGSMATIGKRKAVADIKGLKFGGRLAWLLWSFIHLYSIIGFRNKIIVGVHWMWSYLTYDKGNRLIVRKFIRPQKKEKNKEDVAQFSSASKT